MSNDSWSRIQANQQRSNRGDGAENFFALKTSCPSVIDKSCCIGFTCDRLAESEIVRDFGESLKYFADVKRVTASRKHNNWLIKVWLVSASQKSLIEKEWEYCKVSFKPSPLKETSRTIDTLSRLMEGDRDLFNENRIGVIQSFSTDSVFVRYIVSPQNEIYCLYKPRTIRQNGRIVQDPSSFWMFFSIHEDDTFSEHEELKDIDSTNRGADITLLRLIGELPQKTSWNEIAHAKSISAFEKDLRPTNPPNRFVRECVGTFRDGKECFPKLGKNCLPVGMQAFEFARSIAEGSDFKHWDQVSSDKVRLAEYLERQKKKGFGRRGRKKVKIINLDVE